MVFTYDTYMALEGENLEEIVSQEKINEYFVNNDNINYIDLDSSKRKTLVEASIRNYKLQLGKLEIDMLECISSYMIEASNEKDNSKKKQKS